MDSNGLNNLASGLGKALETAPQLYDDGIQPIVKQSTQTVTLLQRAIHAALSPLEIWTLHKEYNAAETKKLLEQKLANVAIEKIVAPEPYVAVPALQAITYCMDNDELRSLFSNLLAKSMVIDTKDNVLPSFVEIIKQLSPQDALLLRNLNPLNSMPIATVRFQEHGNIDTNLVGHITKGITLMVNYMYHINIPFSFNKVSISISNLQRLGLVEVKYSQHLLNTTEYAPLLNTSFFKAMAANTYRFEEMDATKTHSVVLVKGLLTVSPIGREFIKTCVME